MFNKELLIGLLESMGGDMKYCTGEVIPFHNSIALPVDALVILNTPGASDDYSYTSYKINNKGTISVSYPDSVSIILKKGATVAWYGGAYSDCYYLPLDAGGGITLLNQSSNATSIREVA